MNKILLFIKEFDRIQRNKIIIKMAIAIILFSVITSTIAFANYSENVNKGLSDNLIRLHVIANSDSIEDQALKRNIRDIILDFMKSKLKDTTDIEQTKYILNQNKEEIERKAHTTNLHLHLSQ